ncbi:MAG: hypothetical protein WC436_04135 [Candidatus Babeliales bacterium]
MKKFVIFFSIFFSFIVLGIFLRHIFLSNNIPKPNFPLNIETENFKLYCMPNDKLAGQKILDVAEKNFKQLSVDFNHKYSKKINLYVFPDIKDFHQAIGRPDAADRIINFYNENQHSFFTVSPYNPGSYHSAESIFTLTTHGLTYLFIKDIYTKKIPNWFIHGIGLWKAKYVGKYGYNKILNELSQNHQLIPSLKQLEDSDFSSDIYLSCSYLIIEFINQKWGWYKILALLNDFSSFEKILEISKEKFREQLIDYLDANYSIKK